MGPLRKTLSATGAAAGVIAAGWVAYAGLTWLNFGKHRDTERSAGLDAAMPQYDVTERNEIVVQAAPAAVFAAMRRFSLFQSPLIASIMKARATLLGAKRRREPALEGFVNEMKAFGWSVLDEVPGRRIVLGCATRPWEADVTFRYVNDEAWHTFAERDYVKIAVSIEALPSEGDTVTLLRTTTRAYCTDDEARTKFRLYWTLFSPGIWLIRWEGLRMIRDYAERER